jgi:hypothetical protein
LIVKIQLPLNDRSAPVLIYDQTRTLKLMVNQEDLPTDVRRCVQGSLKVYWNAERGPSRSGPLSFSTGKDEGQAMTKQTFAALVVIESEDPILDAAQGDDPARLRAAVVAALPRLTSVVALMPEDEARLMIHAHLIALEHAGVETRTFNSGGPRTVVH